MIQRGTFANRFIAVLVVLFSAPAPEQVLAELPKVETAQAILEPTIVDTLKSLINVDKMRYLVEGSSFFIEADKQADKQVLRLLSASRTVDYPMEGVSLGQGWDSLRETKAPGGCIVFSPEDSGGQRARVETHRILDTDSLRKAMELSTSISAKAKYKIGGGGGSRKYDFVTSSQVSNHYLNLLVKGSVINGMTFVSPSKTQNGFIELTPQASALLEGIKSAEEKRNKFLKYCGDSYVAAIERGAELYALYQFSDKKLDKQERKTRHLSANADYMAFSGTASTSSNKTLETVQQMQASGLQYMHSAHRGLRLPYNEESINTALASLGSAPEAVDAQPFRIVLMRYDSLPNWTHGPLMSGSATRDSLVAMQFRLTDLESTIVDIQRNPTKYDLTQDADLVMAELLPQLIRKQLSRIDELLDACEKSKEVMTTETQKGKVIERCAPSLNDAMLSDYPIRMLMPILKPRLTTSPTESETQTRKNAIQVLRNQFNTTKATVRVGLGTVKLKVGCPQTPSLDPCASILQRITRLENELNQFKDDNHHLNVAESRYRYWIEEIADSRKEEGALNGSLSASEKALFRREIYCQYGKSPDSAECPNPEKSLTGLVLQGGDPLKMDKVVSFDLEGEQKPTPEEAMADVKRKVVAKIASLVERVPHSYEILEQAFYSKDNTQGQIAYQVKGRALITYYKSDDEKTNRLQSLFRSPF